MLSRREFLGSSAALSTAAIAGCATESGVASLIPDAAEDYPTSMTSISREELDIELEIIAGQMPTEMSGHTFTIGSVPTASGGPQVVGDGMIYRIDFDGPTPALKSRLVRTDCFLIDEATKENDALGFENKSFVRTSSAFGVRNFANTAFEELDGHRLLVTYDAGRPWEINPETLEVITPVGQLDKWRPFLPPVSPALNFLPLSMTSAHPAYDAADGLTYMANFASPVEGLGTEPFTRLLRWDGMSEPEYCEVVDQNGDPALIMMACHQILVTAQHVILLDTAFRLEAEAFFGGDPITRPAIPETTMWIIAKADFVAGGQVSAIRASVPTEGAHALCTYDDSDGTTRILVFHQNSFDPSEWIAPNDVVRGSQAPVRAGHIGLPVQPADRTLIGQYHLDLTSGEVLDSKLFSDPESWAMVLFTRDHRQSGIDGFGCLYTGTFGFEPNLLTERFIDAYKAHPYRQVPLSELPQQSQPSQMVALDADELQVIDRFVMPVGYVGLSPTFVPKSNGNVDDGYLVVFVVNDRADEVWIFDAADLASGPVCRLGHTKLDFGFTLHTAWVPELVDEPSRSYMVDRNIDYENRVSELADDAQAIARAVLGI